MSITSSRKVLIQNLGAQSLVPDAGRDITFRGLEFDSRAIRGGELFVALKGETTHGNSYIEQALRAGAALVLAEKSEAPLLVSEQERVLTVPDSLAAFSELARWWRRTLQLPTVAITGSVGKTTVKEMLACILAGQGPGTYSAKSHNNHVGVPYTICQSAPSQSWMVLEMGMNHSGELRTLSQIAEPRIAAVTTIAPAHIGHLGSLEAIARAKLEILEGLQEGGLAILPADDPVLVPEFEKHPLASSIRASWFGSGKEADLRIIDIVSRGFDGIEFTMIEGGEQVRVSMAVLGVRNAMNAGCAALCARSLFPSLSLSEIAQALGRFTAPLMRLNLRFLKNKGLVVDDSYNANPASMSALIEFARSISEQGARVGLLLGEMRELGAQEEMYHRQLGAQVAESRAAFCIAVGPACRFLLEECKAAVPGEAAEDPAAAARRALELGFDVLFVKASRGVQLDKAVEFVINTIGEAE